MKYYSIAERPIKDFDDKAEEITQKEKQKVKKTRGSVQNIKCHDRGIPERVEKMGTGRGQILSNIIQQNFLVPKSKHLHMEEPTEVLAK